MASPEPLPYRRPSVLQGSALGMTVRANLKAILIGMWVIAGLGVAGVGAAVWLMRPKADPSVAVQFASDQPDSNGPLPVLFDTPPFALTDQDGRPFDDKRLHGHVWVADFVFTHCTTFCPVMTSAMCQFQNGSAAAGLNDVRMASFTVDPDRDTPAVLKEYAKVNGADESRWTFLTGTKKQLWDLSTGMKLSVGPGDDALGGAAGMQVMHSSHFLLVDKQGHVRGVYDFKDAAYLKKLLSDVKKVDAE